MAQPYKYGHRSSLGFGEDQMIGIALLAYSKPTLDYLHLQHEWRSLTPGEDTSIFRPEPKYCSLALHFSERHTRIRFDNMPPRAIQQREGLRHQIRNPDLRSRNFLFSLLHHFLHLLCFYLILTIHLSIWLQRLVWIKVLKLVVSLSLVVKTHTRMPIPLILPRHKRDRKNLIAVVLIRWQRTLSNCPLNLDIVGSFRGGARIRPSLKVTASKSI